MEKREDISSSTKAASKPRKRNLLFLTGNKRTSLQNSVSLLSRSDCKIKMENNISATEKRKIVSGPTINIDINEKIEIRLGQVHTKNTKEHNKPDRYQNNFQNDRENNTDAAKKRKLPDLKPISGAAVSMKVASRANERLSETSEKLNSTPNLLKEMFSTPKVSNQNEEYHLKRRRIEISHTTVNTKRSKWKCKKCSFQHTSKEEVVLHVRNVHKHMENKNLQVPIPRIPNVSNACQLNLSNNLQTPQKDSRSEENTIASPITRGSGSKAYCCEACPYATGCKSQFINHARFHRPNNGDFKCKHCTYNVTHKHLLLQHVRVHGVFDITSESVTDSKRLEVDSSSTDFQNKGKPDLSYNVKKSSGVVRRVGIGKSMEAMISSRRINAIRQYNLIKSREMAKTTIHLCNVCPARFFDAKQLKTHRNFHSANFRIKCKMCSFSSVQKEHLDSHVKVHSKVYQFKTRKLLNMCAQARLQHPIQEKATGESLPHVSVANDNVKSNITGSTTNDSVIYCEQCPSKFYSGILYRQHNVYHGKQTNYKCRICNFGTDTITELAIHKLIHAGSDIDIARGNHWMKFGVFVKNENVISLQTGSRAKYYKCNKCPFEFSKRDRYELHLKQHGSNQKYTCTICDFSVNLYVNYVQHLKKHGTDAVEPNSSNTSNVDNDNCVADSTSSGSLVQTQNQLYKCEICPFYAVDESTVNLHKQKHDSLNGITLLPSKDESLNVTTTYTCSFCDFMTSDNHLLQQHEELHSELNQNQATDEEFKDESVKDPSDDEIDTGEVNNELNSEEENCLNTPIGH